MLYEVITYIRLTKQDEVTGNFLISACWKQRVGSRQIDYFVAFLVKAEATFRITSYNVCYTKLLRAIGVGKLSFGGLGNNPFNPALVGRVFLLISFPVQMTSWPVNIHVQTDARNNFV